MASLEVTESVRKAWRRYCRKHGRIMKDFTSETLKAVIRGEYIKGVDFKLVRKNRPPIQGINDDTTIHT